MSVTAQEKKRKHAPLDSKGADGEIPASARAIDHLAASHAADIVHGLIEGYVIVDQHLQFCTLRGGRMLFWDDQHDVGHVPPSSVWDISGMTIVAMDTEEEVIERQKKARAQRKWEMMRNRKKSILKRRRKQGSAAESKGSVPSASSLELGRGGKADDDILTDDEGWLTAASDDSEEEEYHPWEWTIVLAHIHRTDDSAETGEDPMKLAIHGLEDHSDHDFEDWRDALSVALATLNPIAIRRAHIREALSKKRKRSRERGSSIKDRLATHDSRDQIICLGYNEMFPAVLALGDATDKEVVVLEYDPSKINAVKKHYNRAQRQADAEASKPTRKPVSPKGKGSSPKRGRFSPKAKPETNHHVPLPSQLRGVHCEYADVHDPESWEHLEMDGAFMVVSCMVGAHHAEKAIAEWLKRHNSETIFIGCTGNNKEALELYDAGAHFVMQTDALAMRSSKQIFLKTVASVGDCSQLVIAGSAHARRLKRLREEDKLRFLYETG
jgi:hypothetical protein